MLLNVIFYRYFLHVRPVANVVNIDTTRYSGHMYPTADAVYIYSLMYFIGNPAAIGFLFTAVVSIVKGWNFSKN